MLRTIFIMMTAMLVMPITAVAEKMMITRLTDNTVTIGSRKLKAGDYFDDADVIRWTKPT